MKSAGRYFLLSLVILFVLASLVFYNNMLHLACVVSLLLALLAGGLFTLSLNRRYVAGLDRQEELRKRLTADVAHELRTPLTAVSANLEAFAEGALEPTPERLAKCHDEIRRLSRLVSDMESLAKTEADILNLRKKPFDLLEATRSVFDEVEGDSVIVNADRERIVQVLTNLRSNAEKYGGEEIHVTVRERARCAEIAVTDKGTGIAEEDLPHIFERFYRADKSRSPGHGSTGIGLAIVRSIVDAHGGTVSVESEPGRGSRFTVSLRLR